MRQAPRELSKNRDSFRYYKKVILQKLVNAKSVTDVHYCAHGGFMCSKAQLDIIWATVSGRTVRMTVNTFCLTTIVPREIVIVILQMTTEAPTKEHLREVLLFMFNSKKSAIDSQKMIAEVFDKDTITTRVCQKWFKGFRESDFNLSNKERGRQPKQFEDKELHTLLDENDAQTKQQLAYALGVTHQTILNRLQFPSG